MWRILIIIMLLYSSGFASDSAKEVKLTFGVASVVSAEESVAQYTDLGKYIAKKLGIKIDIIQSSNYADMNAMISLGKVSFASICTGALLYLDNTDILVLPVVKGKETYNSYIITNKASSIKSFDELKGKTFAYTDSISNSGTLYPKYVVASRYNKSDSAFFSKTFYTQSHDKSIYLVNQNVVDAAAVDSLIFEYIKSKRPKDVANINIIEVSPNFMSPPFVVSNDIPKELTKKIRDVLTQMHNDDEGRQILAQIGIDKFTVPVKTDIETVTEMKKYVDSIK